ncbi:YicC/YloC family endoribonuclease [Nitratireductor indicus]|uniref:YicC family protein n=1 Tax=Nitratireductor indicus C115 TaxID=1231190 RepID=K2N600_9HYPH|nr:YicC/YloC family endoribonuclease [Nitratireductor indicus]EKF42903.1 hypothetical protein NA8A_09554 [Nitratireductor indicus C115]MDS1134732.1 YicC/YloC family endoribonuclease [Nitratireductor indicus]SFQ42054.1 TIGR00255 family protein [Nitratireductor indicus]
MSELQSMTGFARASRELEAASVAWEIKSVNGRSLEARFRLPQGFERIEQGARQRLQKRFARGNLQISLTVNQTGAERRPVVDEAFLKDVAGLAARLTEQFGVAPASADGLLALRGVLDFPEPGESDEAREALDAVIFDTFEEALRALEDARRTEGAALGALLLEHVARIEALTARAEADPSRTPDMIRARLKEQVSRLMEATSGLDETRLHMEAAVLATKADIREELDRLTTHVASARALVAAGGAVGRKLDFLGQEFNREANTLCSKSNAASVTAIGLDLKAVVDQFREQVQNLE